MPGTSVPEHVINCLRRVPDSFDVSKYSTVLDLIEIVELGRAGSWMRVLVEVGGDGERDYIGCPMRGIRIL